MLPVDAIEPSPWQARTAFDDTEIAALAIFLDRFTGGQALYADRGGELEVVPNERGKTVVEHTQ